MPNRKGKCTNCEYSIIGAGAALLIAGVFTGDPKFFIASGLVFLVSLGNYHNGLKALGVRLEHDLLPTVRMPENAVNAQPMRR